MEEQQNYNSIKSIGIRLCLTSIILVVAAVGMSYLVLVRNSEKVLRERVCDMLSSWGEQLQLNLDTYLCRVEQCGVLICSSEENYTYDASEAPEEIREDVRERITESLARVNALENFTDFGIVYRSGVTLGEISPGRLTQGREALFQTLASKIDDETGKAWFAMEGRQLQLCYAKRLNDNAILLASFYTEELKRLFTEQIYTKDTMIGVVDASQATLFAIKDLEMAEELPAEVLTMMGDSSDVTMMGKEYIISVHTCENGWRMVTASKLERMLAQNRNIMLPLLVIFLTVAVSVIVSLLVTRSVTNPLDHMVKGLNAKAEHDLLTSTLNKRAFEEFADREMEELDYGQSVALFLTDIDDFKKVNDTYGHIGGDKILMQYGGILNEVFKGETVGRIGGDEFAVMVKIPRFETEINYVTTYAKKLKLKAREMKLEDLQVTISIGISIKSEEDGTFKSLYSRADKALYQTKSRGKNGFTIFGVDERGVKI